MGDLLVRGLDRATIDQLKAQAKRQKRSLQAEAKAILEEAADRTVQRARFAETARRIRESLPYSATDSTDLIRADRER